MLVMRAPNIHVLFDDFTITHTESAVVQGDGYYPFGLTFNSYQRIGNQANRFKYNSFKIQDDFDFNLYDYQARFYDPALGRFINIDPAADLMRRHSPYNYAFDNPIRFTDPDGMVPEDQNGDQENGDQENGEVYEKDGKYHVDVFFSSDDSGDSDDSSGSNGKGSMRSRIGEVLPHDWMFRLFKKLLHLVQVFQKGLRDGETCT